MSKKILIVYPHNPFENNSGINTRYQSLFTYLYNRKFEIHLLSLAGFESDWNEKDSLPPTLIHEFFLYDFRKRYSQKNFSFLFEHPLIFLKNHIFGKYAYSTIPDYAFRGMKKKIKKLITTHSYGHILISYIQWANLIDMPLPPSVQTILDVSDFTTLKLYQLFQGNVKVGRMMDEEIRRINLFKKVMFISMEEQKFFSQFGQKEKFVHVPFFMEKPQKNHTQSKKEYDLIFVGSDNPFNREGIKWFLKKVLPVLGKNLQIAIVGTVSAYVPTDQNIRCIPQIKKLDAIYRKSKIAICPLLGGTGLKIKVVEAMAHGLPVVSTSHGLTGVPDTSRNGILIGNTPASFADHINTLLGDTVIYNKISREGQQYFNKNYSSIKNYHRLDNLFILENENQSVSIDKK